MGSRALTGRFDVSVLELHDAQNISMADAIRAFDAGAIDPQECRRSAARFDTSVFRRRLQAEVSVALA